jgi:sugar (pentulose or hexulose) kinase
VGGAYLLGIDAGTTTIKSTLFDLTGHELAGAEQQSSLVAPETSWAESDLGEVWKAVQQTVRRTLAQAAVDPAEVVAVGVTGQGDGSWLIDRQGRPVRPSP